MQSARAELGEAKGSPGSGPALCRAVPAPSLQRPVAQAGGQRWRGKAREKGNTGGRMGERVAGSCLEKWGDWRAELGKGGRHPAAISQCPPSLCTGDP